MFWPSATVAVIAVLFGIQFIVHGLVRVAQAVGSGSLRAGARIMLAVLGLVSMAVGLVFLARPMRTVTVLALLMGLFWLIAGLIEVVRAAVYPEPGRGLEATGGVLSVLAGVLVLAWPEPTVLVLAVLVGFWALLFGVLMVVLGLRRRPAGA